MKGQSREKGLSTFKLGRNSVSPGQGLCSSHAGLPQLSSVPGSTGSPSPRPGPGLSPLLPPLSSPRAEGDRRATLRLIRLLRSPLQHPAPLLPALRAASLSAMTAFDGRPPPFVPESRKGTRLRLFVCAPARP